MNISKDHRDYQMKNYDHKRFHTGYYLSFEGGKCTPGEYSKRFIKDPLLELIDANFRSKDWHIEWIYSEKWRGLEFIIVTTSLGIAQNVLFNVLCAAAVINGTVSWTNEAHYAHEFGTIEKTHEIDLTHKPVKGFSNISIPEYFYLSCLASHDFKLANAIVKYQLSTEIYSHTFFELNEEINWKTTDFPYMQIRFAYAIIAAYAVIEELGLEVRASKELPSRINEEWNPPVLADLQNRLKSANINIDEHIAWMKRGDETEIEKKRPIEIIREAEWASPNDDDDDFRIKIMDGYVYLPDAINHISYLRSNISSHAVGNKVMELSVFDVANAQALARRLILQKTGMWR